MIINPNSFKPTTCILAPTYILNVIDFHNTIFRIRYLLIARMLRLIRILMHVQRYRAFIATFLTLIPSLMPYLGTVFCVMCIYCSMGIQVLTVFMLGICLQVFHFSASKLCACSLYTARYYQIYVDKYSFSHFCIIYYKSFQELVYRIYLSDVSNVQQKPLFFKDMPGASKIYL